MQSGVASLAAALCSCSSHEKNLYALAALGLGAVNLAKGEGLITNGGFESGDARDDLNSTLGSPPARTDAEAHSGKYSTLDAQEPTVWCYEGTSAVVVSGGRGQDVRPDVWAKQTIRVSYVQEYAIEWYDDNAAPGKGLTRSVARTSGQGFGRGHPGPGGRPVCGWCFDCNGAVAGGSGEVFIDDVALVASDGSGRWRFSQAR